MRRRTPYRVGHVVMIRGESHDVTEVTDNGIVWFKSPNARFPGCFIGAFADGTYNREIAIHNDPSAEAERRSGIK